MQAPKYLPVALLGLLLLCKLAAAFALVHPQYQLHRDEFLHVDMGRHLQWGYLSVQPATAWLSWLVLHWGASETAVRLLPALAGVFTMIYLYRITLLFTTHQYLGLASAAGYLLSPMLRMNLLYQPNSLDILCWTVGYFYLFRYLLFTRFTDVYKLGLVVVAGLYCKYNFLFWMAGAACVLMLAKAKHLLLNRHSYLASAMVLLLLMPTLIWQHQHEYPLFQFVEALRKNLLDDYSTATFLKEQLLIGSALIFPALAGMVSLAKNQHGPAMRAAAFHIPVVLALYVWQQGKGYYAVGLYPAFMALGIASIYRFWRGAKYWLGAWMLLCAGSFLFLLPIAFPYKSPEVQVVQNHLLGKMGLLRWEDGENHLLPQDYADMLGWKQLAHIADSAYQSLPQGETLIFTDNYGQAGAINFYSKISGVHAYTLHADYRNWFPYEKPFQHMIRIYDAYAADSTELSKLKGLFTEVKMAGVLTNSLARENGTTVFICMGAKRSLGALIQEESLRRSAF